MASIKYILVLPCNGKMQLSLFFLNEASLYVRIENFSKIQHYEKKKLKCIAAYETRDTLFSEKEYIFTYMNVFINA